MLVVVDGTWSMNFNSDDNGNDPSGRAIGNSENNIRSNSRRFFEESRYPENKKFYFVGPGDGMSGNDSWQIYFNVLRLIEREINSGNCTELSLVGWSRGAAIISELTEGLAQLADGNSRRNPVRTGRGERMRTVNNVLSRPMPTIKYVGLFDSVAMIWRAGPIDGQWGEDVEALVQYFAHVTAGDRTGPVGGLVDFRMADPNVQAARTEVLHIGDATHGGVGGADTTAHGQQAYDFIRQHATNAGCL